MAILKRSKQSIVGLDVQLANIETNITNNLTNLNAEITRAQNAEGVINNNLNSVTATVNILNADSTTVGSVDKKIIDATSELMTATNTYTKVEVDNIVSTKLDSSLVLSTVSSGNLIVTQTELNLKANSSDVYSKSEMDTNLDGKADASSTYTKTEVDSIAANLANTSDVYTKTETDNLIAPKANSSDVYTKTEVDSSLANKVNTTDTITAISSTNKIATQTELDLKANSSDVYTKPEVDSSLSGKINTTDTVTGISSTNKVVTEAELSTKANTTDVYTQTQINDALALKLNSTDGGKIGPSLKVVDETNIADTKILSYDAASGNIVYVDKPSSGDSIDDGTITSTTTWSSSKIKTELDLKADADNVYTKTEVDTSISAASQGIKYAVADIDALNALTDMEQDDQALVESDRYVYKYDATDGWVQFYAMDATHNHDDLYYTKSEADTFLGTKLNSTDGGKIGPSLKVVDETNIADTKILSYDAASGNIVYVDKPADGLPGEDGADGTLADDSVVSTSTTWTSSKIDSELSLKADAAETYTKTEVDDIALTKVNVGDVLSEISTSNKVVTQTDIAGKADATNVYTTSEIDSLALSKVNTSDVLSSITDSNKVVTQTDIAGKADATNVYTKSESDSNLSLKANTSDVYTKSEIDSSLAGKLNTTDSVTSVSDTNKLVTESEITSFANSADVYTKSEVDAIVLPKFDDAVALTSVSTSNKLVTETELSTKVNTTDIKTSTSSTNKIVTESDVTAAIDANNATLSQAPIIAVDRPILSTQSANDLDYVFSFPLSKTPHGLIAVNDEITIYDYDGSGQSIVFENVSLFSDKHGEIAVTLASTSDEDDYAGKTIKVCYLTTETTVTPGTDEAHPIIINTNVEFESQGSGTTNYSIDFSQGNYYMVQFDVTEDADGNGTDWNPKVSVVLDTSHSANGGFHSSNSTDYEANLYLNDDDYAALDKKSIAWPGTSDEAQYIQYNWTMAIEADANDSTGNIYILSFTQGDSVGGGAL